MLELDTSSAAAASDHWHWLDQCMLVDLHRASRRITTRYNERLRPTGLTMVHFTLMRNIAAIGPASITQLATTLLMDRTSVTRLLAPLLRRGFVAVAPSSDRRQKNVVLAEAGQRAIEASEVAWRAAQNDLHQVIGHRQWLAMRRALRSTVKSVRAHLAARAESSEPTNFD